jgi:hypothetical protein
MKVLMSMKYKISLMIFLLISVVVLTACESTSPETIAFAKCLTEKEAKMYGAYWCPHCQDQKKEFGDAWSEINYIECSLPGGRGVTEICEKSGIESYPTWEFAGGDRLTGKLSFGQLSANTGCELP